MREFCLRQILRASATFPQTMTRRVVAAAWEERGEGRLLSLSCDAWGIPVGVLAELAGVTPVQLSQFVTESGEPLSDGQRERLKSAFVVLTRRSPGK